MLITPPRTSGRADDRVTSKLGDGRVEGEGRVGRKSYDDLRLLIESRVGAAKGDEESSAT